MFKEDFIGEELVKDRAMREAVSEPAVTSGGVPLGRPVVRPQLTLPVSLGGTSHSTPCPRVQETRGRQADRSRTLRLVRKGNPRLSLTSTRRPPRRPGGGSPGDGDGGVGGGPGGGGGGPPDLPDGPLGGGPSRDPILHQLLARLVSAEEKRADLDAAGSRKRELNFKFDAALPEVTTDDPVSTVEAFD